MPPTEEVVREFQFWQSYWDFAEWYLIAVGVIFLVMLILLRRPGQAFGVLVLGGYATLSWHFMHVYDHLGYSQEWALGIVIGGGLALGSAFYYFIFVRTG